MTKRLIVTALAVGTGLAPFAQAQLRVSPDGLGDALYLPYYSVEDGQTSLLTVSNAGTRTTAVQVLLAESANGQNVMSFSVFLPPGAAWSTAIIGEGAGAGLAGDSAVCSVPELAAVNTSLREFDYAFNYPDAGPTGVARTRTGAVEVIELGEVEGALSAAALAGRCAEISESTSDGWTAAVAAQFSAPSGNVSASLQVVKVEDGVIFQVPAIAFRGYSDRALVGAGFGAAGSNADPFRRLANPILPANAEEYIVQVGAERLRVPANRGPDAISLLFMQSALSGTYHTTPTLGADTRWVIAFPTKHAYVHARPGSLMSGALPAAPFSAAFGTTGACEPIAAEASRLSGAPLAVAEQPFAGADLALCGQVNVVDFGAPSVDEGSARLRFAQGSTRVIEARGEDGRTRRLSGLPAVGLRLSTFVNGQAQPGVLANYSVAEPLRAPMAQPQP